MTAFDCYVKVGTFGSAFNQDCISLAERSLFKQVCLRNFKCSGRCRGGVVEVAICPAQKSVYSNNQSPAYSGGGLQPANQPLPSPVPA